MRNCINCNISIVALILFVGLCSCYITSVSHFSPYYFGLLLLIAFSFILLINNYKMRNDYVSKSLSTIVIVMASFLIFNIYKTTTIEKMPGILFLLLINQISTLIIYNICFLSSQKTDSRYFIKDAVHLYFFIEVILGIIDLIYRFAKRTDFYSGIQYFYNFKSSIMFEDSNWNGFIYMISFAFFLYLYDNYRIIGKWHLRILFIFCVFSLSRAAVFSSIIVIIFSRFIKFPYKKRKMYVVFLILVSSFVLPFLIFFVTHDDSFNTKIVIIKGLAYYISHTPIDKLLIGFGTGFASSEYSLPFMNYAWVQGHLYLVVKILDIGLIGICLELLYFYALIRFSKIKFLYLFIPFFVCGLSMAPTNLSFLYCFAGIIVFIEQNRTKMKEC